MPKSPVDPEWERPGDCARALGVARSTVYAAIARGELDARKFGGCTIISVASRKALARNLPKAQIALAPAYTPKAVQS
jgi:hypothetical protein